MKGWKWSSWGSQSREAGVGGLPLLSERGTLSIPSFSHLDFHLLDKRITKCFLFLVCQALGWVLGYGCYLDLLLPSGGSLGVWEGAILTDNCPVAGAMEREAQDDLASREMQSNQAGLSNIWKNMGKVAGEHRG